MYKKQHFSLIELLVVIAIVGILVAMLISGGKKLRQRAKLTETRSAMFSIKGAIINYKKEYGTYPHYNVDASELHANDKVVYTNGATGSGDWLIDVLSGVGPVLSRNPRKIQLLPKNYSYKSIFTTASNYEGYAITIGVDTNGDGQLSLGLAKPRYGIRDTAESEKYSQRSLVVFMRNPFYPEQGNITTF